MTYQPNGVRAIACGTVAGPAEVWLPCPGYEDRYAVSSLGHIRALRKGGGVLSTPPNHDGYPHVCLRKDGKARVIQLHRLIALAFHGDKRNALHNEVAHLDGDRANACADNLQWVSKVENRSHRKLHGTDCDGQNHASAKLTNAQAAIIRSLRGLASYRDMASEYGVSIRTIHDVIYGRTYRQGPSTIAGPSRSFIELTRNIELAEQAPRRFEPTIKGEHDVVI